MELAHWLCFPHEMSLGHRSKEYDLLVRSGEKERPVVYNYPFDEKQIRFNEPIPFERHTLLIYRFLPLPSLQQEELNGAQIGEHGWYHHQLLHKMLLWVDEMFVPFLNYIFQFRKDAILKTNKQSERVLYLLKILMEQIDRKNILEGIPLIPDLFTFHRDTNLMSFKEQVPYEWIGKDRDGFKYTYMFSTHTSRNFAEALLNLLRKRYHDQLFIQSLDEKAEKYEIHSKEQSYRLPKHINARIDFLENYYGLHARRENAKLKYTKAQLMFLFRILEDTGIFHKDLGKEEFALAISLLTGISFSQVYNNYPSTSKMDCEKLFGIKNRQILKAKIKEICDASRDAVTKGEKKYSFN